MTNALATMPGVWGSGIRRAAPTAEQQEQMLAAAREHASGAIDLAVASPALVAALALGLALWLVGDRLFRPASSLIGAIIGALLGLALSANWQGDVAGLPAPYAAIGLGSLLGLAIGAAMYRLAVGSAAAVTLAGVGAVIAATVALHQPQTPLPERPETIAEAASARVRTVALTDGRTMDDLRAAAATARDALVVEWGALPGEVRSMVTAAAILGCVLGFAIGVIRPRTAGPAIAALAGAALWIGATTALLAQAGRAIPPLPTERPGPWLAAWLLVALVGFAVQRRVVRPAALVAKEGDE